MKKVFFENLFSVKYVCCVAVSLLVGAVQDDVGVSVLWLARAVVGRWLGRMVDVGLVD